MTHLQFKCFYVCHGVVYPQFGYDVKLALFQCHGGEGRYVVLIIRVQGHVHVGIRVQQSILEAKGRLVR